MSFSVPACDAHQAELAVVRDSARVKATFLHPKYWPTWLGIGILRLFEPLPHRLLYLLGRGLGGFIHLFPTPFKRIARRNIELALPELDARGAASASCANTSRAWAARCSRPRSAGGRRTNASGASR